MSGSAPFNQQWIARFENTALYNNPGSGTAFYYDGHVNIGFGYNLTSNIGVARNALAAAGLTFTNPQWANVVTYARMNTAAGTATLNSLVPERITQTQAYTVLGNYLNHTVIPGLEAHITNFGTLPDLTQAALENVYYDHSTLLGPTTYGYANDGDLVGVAEQLAFNADNTASDQTGAPGLERRFLADGFLALNVDTTINGSNLISAVDTTGADATDVSQFLDEILSGTLEVGGNGSLTPLQYVQQWGTAAVQDYRNATMLLDRNLAQRHSVYVAEDNNTVPNINNYNLSFTGAKFTLFTAGSYKGTITGFTPGRTLDLAGIGNATAATLGTGNKLTITGGTDGPFTIQLATGQNYTGDKFKVASDGDGGTNVTIIPPPNVGRQVAGGGSYTNPPGQSIVGLQFGVYAPSGGATFTNQGSVQAVNGTGVEIIGNGTITNSGGITGLAGVIISAVGKLLNSGTITGQNGNAVQFNDGGSVTNEASGVIDGTSGGVIITSATGTILNSGSITASAASGVGTELSAGGTLDNQTSTSVIRGGEFGLWAPGGPANVTNLGTLVGTNNAGVEISGTADVSNQGVITGANGVVVGGHGVLVNAASITATNGNAVQVNNGGSVTNDAGKAITGTAGGVIITSVVGTILNSGSITASAASGVGTELSAGGTLDNQTSTSVIRGGEFGLWAPGGPANVTNLGTLVGTNNAGVEISGTADVSNQGVITGANGVVVGGAGVLVNAASVTATNGNAVQINHGGSVTNDAGKAITGTAGGVIITSVTGTILNSGRIIASASSGVGSELGAGGTLDNQTSASVIRGGEFGIWAPGGPANVTNLGTLAGTNNAGVEIAGTADVSNQGVITGANGVVVGGAGVLVNAASVTATNGNAVQINHGGSVTNKAGKRITGTAGGVIITSATGTIQNRGSIIASASSGVGTELGAGGTLDNQTSTSVISGGEFGLSAPGGPANVTNLGTLAGTNNAGVEIAGTADVNNQGVITGANGVVVGGHGVLVNAASVTATNGNAVQINDGGSVTNNAGKRITGTAGGVIITSVTGTIQNSGSIAASASSGVGSELGAGGKLDNQTSTSVISGGEFGLWAPGGPANVTNLGTLVGTNNAGVEIAGTADVSNQGVITGANGVVVGGHGVLVNAASITATNGNAVQINDGGSVTNDAGKSITGTAGGVIITSAAGTIHNSGSITASAASGVGAELGAGGTLTDAAGATITGGEFGIWGPAGAAQVTVDGTVKGGTGVELSGSGSTLTVSGTIIGTGGVAVDLATGNRLIAEAGATFVGQVIDPGAADTLELASGQGTIGSNVQGFGAIAVDAGGDWTLGGLTSVAQAANAGTVALASGASLDIGAASGGGLYQLEAGATLDLHNLADGGPRVSFLGGGDLTLSAAASAAPLAVSGFGAGDTIDVRDLAPAGLMLASNGSGGVQLADQAGVLADLSFASGSAGALLPTSDHHGGVLVTVG